MQNLHPLVHARDTFRKMEFENSSKCSPVHPDTWAKRPREGPRLAKGHTAGQGKFRTKTWSLTTQLRAAPGVQGTGTGWPKRKVRLSMTCS